MPLFMDRHDVPGATAEDAASAHVSDLAVAGKHGVEFLSYWFDPDRESVFCFARSPARENLVTVHKESHGLVPHEIIGVSEDSVLRFLGTVKDPADASEVTSPFRVIVFTDLEGSTALTEEVGQSEFMLLLTEHDLIIRSALVAQKGREVKHTVDGFLISFDAATDALSFCVTAQQGFRGRLEAGARHDLSIKVGVAAGEPVDHNDDIFGTAVNLASRLCGEASGGTVFTSGDIPGIAGDEFRFREAGDRVLKGFSEPVAIYELLGNA